MIATVFPRPSVTPAKEPNKIEAGITRAEIVEYFLYDSINPSNRKRRMSRSMAKRLADLVSRNESIAEVTLPPGWFEVIHQIEATPELLTERTVERHREVIAARHRAVMRLVALEQAKLKAGASH